MSHRNRLVLLFLLLISGFARATTNLDLMRDLTKGAEIPYFNGQRELSLIFGKSSDYYAVTLYTISTKMDRCKACIAVLETLNDIKANSVPRWTVNKPIFFAAVDTEKNDKLKHLTLENLPAILFNKNGQLDFYAPKFHGLSKEKIENWIMNKSGAYKRVTVAEQLSQYLTLGILGSLVWWSRKRILRFFIKSFIPMASVVFCAVMVSGYSFCNIRGSPVTAVNDQGEEDFVLRQQGGQTYTEIFIVSGLVLAQTFSLILLTEIHRYSKGSTWKMYVITIVGLAGLLCGFSYVISLARYKAFYKFSLFFH